MALPYAGMKFYTMPNGSLWLRFGPHPMDIFRVL